MEECAESPGGVRGDVAPAAVQFRSAMQIDQSQMNQLLANAETEFQDRVLAYLKERQPAEVAGLPDDTLKLRIRFSLAVARQHGFTAEAALVAFTCMMFIIGPDFWRQPAFVRALKIELPNQMDRINAVYANTTDEDWDLAMAASDPNAWPVTDGAVS